MTTATHFETSNHIATITLNAPDKLNAFTAAMCAELVTHLQSAQADDNIHAVIITGAGRAFSAGIDLGMIETDPNINLGPILENHFEPIFNAIAALDKPLIAAVNGPAAGVSAGIALAADITLASDKAYFLIPFVELGLLPDGALTWLLPRLVGSQGAAGLCLLGEKMSAAEAAQRGLVWKSIAADEFDAVVQQVSELLAKQPSHAVKAAKQALAASWGNSMVEQVRLERELQQQCGRSEVFANNLERFLK